MSLCTKILHICCQYVAILKHNINEWSTQLFLQFKYSFNNVRFTILISIWLNILFSLDLRFNPTHIYLEVNFIELNGTYY